MNLEVGRVARVARADGRGVSMLSEQPIKEASVRLSSILQPFVSVALPILAVGVSCSAPRPMPATTPVLQTEGLILQSGEGERRVRRNAGKGPFIIKVDRQNGGSPDLVMGYEDIAPGAEIQLHRHLVADEILFVHRGSGTASLNGRTARVTAGATTAGAPARIRDGAPPCSAPAR